MKKALIKVKEVSVHYTHKDMSRTCAMHKVSLNVFKNEHVAILGENGSGKSTLLRVLRGEIYPDQIEGGEVLWNENNVFENSPLVGREMTALISPKVQDYYANQAWNVNCLEIMLAAKTNDYILYRTPTSDETEEAHKIAQNLGAEHLLERKITELSQGQLRIMLIARALIRKAPVLLLDEATNGLDPKSQELVLQALENLAKTPTNPDDYCPTLVMTSHRTPLPSFIQKIYHMSDGVLSLQVQNVAEHNQKADIFCLKHLVPSTEHTVGLHISLQNADIYIDHKEILHKVNWDIKPYQQWAVKGANGSGKSTLLKAILGFLPVALGGSIKRTFYSQETQQGESLFELASIKKHIRIVSDALQTHYTYNDTVEDVVFAGLDGNIGVYREASEEDNRLVNNCINELGLQHLRTRPLKSLSTGQARKTLLARALVGKPSLLLLDEPFSGLDEKSRNELKNIFEKLIFDGIQTILVSHHEQDFLPSTTHIAGIENGYFQEKKQ